MMNILYGIGHMFDGTEHYVSQLNGEDEYTNNLKEALLYKDKKELPELEGFKEYYVRVKQEQGKLTSLGILKSE